MDYNEKELKELQKLAFNYALYRTGNYDASNDIASQSIGLFLLKYDTIKKENYQGWIILTCKNYCNTYFKKQKKSNKFENENKNDILNEIYKQADIECDEILKDAFRESISSLQDKELRLILFYFQCDQNIAEMHKMVEDSYAGLRQKISRIKRTLKAKTFMKLGTIYTKKIVTPQINSLIMIFLARFKKNLENNSLYKMHYYFSKVDLKNYNPDYSIKKIINYEIEINDSIYTVWIFFKNKQNKLESFFIRFFINDKNHLKIITPPTKPKRSVNIKVNSNEGKLIKELLKKYPAKRDGSMGVPSELIAQIMKKVEEKKLNEGV